MSSPGQVRARSPGTASGQNQSFCWPLAHHPLASNSSHQGIEGKEHEILYFNSFILQIRNQGPGLEGTCLELD